MGIADPRDPESSISPGSRPITRRNSPWRFPRRSPMRLHDSPASLTPEERFRELAGLLATGLRRLRLRPSLPADPAEHPGPKNPPESPPNGLELRRETV